MTGHDLGGGPLFQSGQNAEPAQKRTVERGGVVVKDQIAGEKHTRCGIVDRQVGRRMPGGLRRQGEAMAAEIENVLLRDFAGRAA